MLTKKDLVKAFSALEIGGSTVMVHSKPSALGPVEGGAQTIFDALEEVFSYPGQIIWPTFSFALAEGKPFSYRETPSILGSLTEIARGRYLRLGHPIWSFCCRDPRAAYFHGFHYFDAFGPFSMFQNLTELDGKIMIIGLPWNNSWTYVHYIEQAQRAPWRMQKLFRGMVDGSPAVCGAFVRRADIQTNVEPVGLAMERAGLVQKALVGEAEIKMMNAVDAFNFTSNIITTGAAQGMLYEYA